MRDLQWLPTVSKEDMVGIMGAGDTAGIIIVEETGEAAVMAGVVAARNVYE